MIDRRTLLGAGFVASAAAAMGLAVGERRKNQALNTALYHGDSMLGDGDSARVWYRQKFIGQPVMDTQLLFYLGLAGQGLTDIGEVLDTATRITPGDEVSWFEAWCATAERVAEYAEEARSGGHLLTAGGHLRRAGAYWRAGLMRYPDHSDPRMVMATRAALDADAESLSLLGYDSVQVDIPYEQSVLYGRAYFAPGVGRAPVLVMNQGLHAWPEDTMWVIDGALARGYHVFAFHGPGQGASLRYHGHPFRPDWEAAVSAVLDVAEGIDRFDRSRITLMGLSFGGFLAPRAAAHEPRLYALVANPGVLNWGSSMLRHFAEMPGLLELHARGPAAFDGAIATASAMWADAAWYFADATWKHGVATPHELIDELRRYDNTAVAGKIRCKTLIMEGVAEDATPGQSRKLYDALRCDKTLMEFDHASAAQTHCQNGGTQLAQGRLFDWLDERVKS